MKKFFCLVGIITLFLNFSSFSVKSVSADGFCTVKQTFPWYGNPSDNGDKNYNDPVITFIHGVDILNRNLASGDFNTLQSWSQPRKQEHWKVTEYNEWGCGDTTWYETWEFQGHVWSPNTTGSNTGTAIVTIDSNNKNTTGIIKFKATATMNGKTSTIYKNSYWVKEVRFSSSNPSTDFRTDASVPVVGCKITFGNNSTKDCDEGTIDSTGSKQIAANFFTNNVNNFRNMRINTQLQTFYDTYDDKGNYNFMSDPDRVPSAVVDVSLGRSNGSSTRTDTTTSRYNLRKYDFPYGQMLIYSYKDIHTGKYKTHYHRLWKIAIVDVEDEVRTPLKKQVYKGDIEDLEQVTCTVWFYGPIPKKNCFSDMVVNYNFAIAGNTHYEGYNELKDFEQSLGNGSIDGDPYRTIIYSYTYNEDFRLGTPLNTYL